MRNPPSAVKRTQAAILARLGQLEEARRFGAEFMKSKPDYSFEQFLEGWHFEDDTYRIKLAEDLRKAGLSESLG